MNREPEAFQAGALYGSRRSSAPRLRAYGQNHVLDKYAPYACVVLVLGLRYASLFFGWQHKPPRDYTDVVTSVVARPVKSVARRVRPPKGKVERDKSVAATRAAHISGRASTASPLPPERNLAPRQCPRQRPTPVDVPGIDVAPDPSDRIVVNREELRRITGAEDDEPSDPFEPRSSNATRHRHAPSARRPKEPHAFFSKIPPMVSATCSQASQHFSMRSKMRHHIAVVRGSTRLFLRSEGDSP